MEQQLICIGVFAFIILLFFYLLISMDCVEPLEYGLPYNKLTKTIGTEVYDSGRYILNPFKSFLIYPANLVTIEFSNSKTATAEPLQTRTGEGLGLTLSVSFQYQVMKDSIPKLYNMANVNFHSTSIMMIHFLPSLIFHAGNKLHRLGDLLGGTDGGNSSFGID